MRMTVSDDTAPKTPETSNGKPGLDGEAAQTSGGTPTGWFEAFAISAYLLALTLALIVMLVQLWPGPTPAGGPLPETRNLPLLFWRVDISDEVRLLLLVTFTGALGGLLHALRSVAWYVGQRELRRNWLPTYVMQPFVGATLAFIFYLVIRGGFFSPQASFQETSPFGFAAMGGLIGMFSQQAVLKLKEVAEIVLTKPPAGKDNAPQEFEDGRVTAIRASNPTSSPATSPAPATQPGVQPPPHAGVQPPPHAGVQPPPHAGVQPPPHG
jgi:hypothetical protein